MPQNEDTMVIRTKEQTEALAGCYKEMINSQYRIQSEKDLQKEIKKRVKEEKLEKAAIFSKAATTAFRNSMRKLDSETTEVLDSLEECGLYSHNPDEE